MVAQTEKMGEKMKPTKKAIDAQCQLYSFRNPNRRRVQFDTGDKMMTKQAEKDNCDINNIVNRYYQTGQLLKGRNHLSYGYAPDLDFKAAMDVLSRFNADFDGLSEEEQKIFDNNPEIFAQFLDDYDQNPQAFENELEKFRSSLASEDSSEQPAVAPSETENEANTGSV